jgi:hypothetical protein
MTVALPIYAENTFQNHGRTKRCSRKRYNDLQSA